MALAKAFSPITPPSSTSRPTIVAAVAPPGIVAAKTKAATVSVQQLQ
jgi:hypothetical protein